MSEVKQESVQGAGRLSQQAKKLKVLYDEATLAARIRELGEEITRDYEGKPVVLVGVLKGSITFMADLARQIDLPLTMDFLGLSSYGDGTETSGVVRFSSDLTQPIEGKHLLIVEDIVDSGLTMSFLLKNLATRKPASLAVVSLLHKPVRKRVDVPIDYLGFSLEGDPFVVGYGLDHAGVWRNLPYVGVVED